MACSRFRTRSQKRLLHFRRQTHRTLLRQTLHRALLRFHMGFCVELVPAPRFVVLRAPAPRVLVLLVAEPLLEPGAERYLVQLANRPGE